MVNITSDELTFGLNELLLPHIKTIFFPYMHSKVSSYLLFSISKNLLRTFIVALFDL